MNVLGTGDWSKPVEVLPRALIKAPQNLRAQLDHSQICPLILRFDNGLEGVNLIVKMDGSTFNCISESHNLCLICPNVESYGKYQTIQAYF